MASHGRYTILGKLADGGMAEIFLSVQHGAEGFEKPVVLKRILTQYSADPQFRNMLLDEAHISMSLQHGNIVQVLDLGVASGRYFLALELVDGWDLERILQRAHAAGLVFPAALALYVVATVCRALAYAHGKARDGKPLGIVHRDISPNNVLISTEGEVKLADFGIAKAQRKREQTAAGVIKGKVAYMSPEQAQGSAVDRRSDIFSVGSMLYRMMTDKLPFEAANDLESLLRVQKADFRPPQEAKPTVGDAVATIIQRAMRLLPSERYQTAEEMLIEVERVLRNDFHSAGQTELKLWLEQLARKDGVPSIGKAARDGGGVVTEAQGTDLSVGTSFELGDLDVLSISTDQTELQRGRAPSPPPVPPPPPPRAEPRSEPPPAPPRSGSTAEIVKPGGRRRSSGFWLGVFFALGAVVGVRYLISWAEGRGVMRALGLGHDDATEPRMSPAPSPPAEKPAAPAAAPGPTPAAPTAAAGPQAAPAPEAHDAGPAAVAAAAPRDAQADKEVEKTAENEDDEEEALARKAVPNAENAVIGEDEAEAPAPRKPAAKARAPLHATPEIPQVETAILHISSAPAGAVVRTKARVLGRTPINLHFKTGNTYEIEFIKQGYEKATRKVAVHSTQDRKIAVALKKTPPPKRSFLHLHR